MVSKEKYELHKINVLDNATIAPNTFVLSFKRPFNFLPGQVIALTTDKNITPRLYSIASGNLDKRIEILYDVKAEGKLTPQLSILKKGDITYYSLPFGEFIDDENPSFWIATGTGVAPFISMIKSGLLKDKTLIHGARNKQFFFFDKFFANKLGGNYVRCCSQCLQNNMYNGRLTKFLQDKKELPLIQKYYLCGSAEMVVDVRDILIEKGVPFNKIVSEIYF